jgi:predicted nucleotide-binding protein
MPFHVRVTSKKNRSRSEVRLDLTEAELEERFLGPYREGLPIVIGGTVVPVEDLERIRISKTDSYSDQILPIVREQRRNSAVITSLSDDYYIAEYGDDVTDMYITSAPGVAMVSASGKSAPSIAEPDPRKVFVVHGRNIEARDAMFSFLRSLSLHPIEWNEASLATGRPSPYVGEILDTAFNHAAAVLVLMTPDDLVSLREEHHGVHEPPFETEPTGQARPNVLFEAGMAMGRDADRTVLVELGVLRPFSDIGGRHVIHMNDTSQRRQELAQRLLSAGCAVSTTGVDWHSVGDFDAAV